MSFEKESKPSAEKDPYMEEAGGEPWVHQAILERERIIDEINERGGLAEVPELNDQLRQAQGEVDLRKEQFGITG